MYKSESEIRLKVDQYLMDHPIERGKPNCYGPAAEVLQVHPEYVRDRHRKLRAKGMVQDLKYRADLESVSNVDLEEAFKENLKTGEADLKKIVNKRITTLEDLIAACNINTNTWEVVTWEVNKWEVGRKEKSVEWKSKKGQGTGKVHDTGKIFVEPLYQVKAKLSRIKTDKDLGKQKEVVMDELKRFTASEYKYHRVHEKIAESWGTFELEKRNCALEINIPDLHIGKLAWKDESGEDYDIKIAVKRYEDAVMELVGRTNVSNLEKFILVIGHDFLNVDGKNNQTTAGTPQSTDGRFYKMVKIGKQLLIDTIDKLTCIAPVDVVVVPGNHDSNAMLLMGDILEAWYHKSPLVKVLNSAAPRKYYQYGKTGIMYAHGHNEKMDEMPNIFATQNKELWYHTDYHRVHMGHLHHSKQLKFKDIQEYPGCIVKVINSLSSNDAWHNEKGYLSSKGAEAFLYHRDKGLIANYYYTV